MEPYFSEGGVTIYCGDSRDVLPLMEPNSVDLLLTDPPYGQDYQSGRRAVAFDRIVGDESTDMGQEILRLAFRTLAPRRHAYIFGEWDFTDLPVAKPVELIWDKVEIVGGNLTVPWASQHETIQFVSKHPSKANRDAGDGNLTARLRRGSILRHQRVRKLTHPTEKPVGLLRELIESSSRMGETVLDPCMGTGSTLHAALLEGRCAIGIEIDERYCELAVERIQKVLASQQEAA